ncbi:MAG: transglutaminase-like domain-containing protein [Chloroflexi bacterium]|nr:transglutaminase-like domain-containing protein [Chloroflexota bacterium]
MVNRLHPREGWVVLLLAWAAVCSLPAAAMEGGIIAGLAPALWLATLGLLAACWLGHQGARLRGWAAAVTALLLGVVADLAWGVNVLNVGPLIAQGTRWLGWWTRCGATPKCLLSAPPFPYFAEQWAALTGFMQRVAWWVNGAATGHGVADNLVWVGLAGLIAWSMAAWAGWWMARHGKPFFALLPTGILLTQQVYVADAGYAWLLVYLGAATLLMVLTRFYWLTRGWDATGVDYSPEVRLETTGVGLAIAGLVLVLAPLLPFLTPSQISQAFWRKFGEPYQQVEERLAQSFPGVQGRRSLVPPTGVAAGGLPRAHLLGGRPELGQEIALRVWPRGAREGDLLYWRGQTFGRYTGRGWEEDATGKGGSAEQSFPAGAPWAADLPTAGRYPVLSAVEVVEASRAVLYAAGEPVSVDRPYTAIVRAPGELIALSAADRSQRYNVLGQVAGHNPTLLRASNTIYPSQIISLYLALPPDLPPELTAYAAQVTTGAETPYDAALAIETALRKLPYTLDVPPPPAGREIVSWFLSDLRKGYCDYFATAMAVLARVRGIPSRLAIGYAAGAFDERTGGYVVTELQAHSWPELYFPGYGWIPFEPTPSQPLGERVATAGPPPPVMGLGRGPEDLDAGLTELRQLASAASVTTRRIVWAQRVLAAINGLLACWMVGWLIGWWLAWRFLTIGGEAAVGYARLVRWGARLGRPLRLAETATEYAAAVTQTAETLAGRARWGRGRVASAPAVVRADALRLAQAFETALYGPADVGIPASPQLQPAARSARPALWSALRRLWLARWRI